MVAPSSAVREVARALKPFWHEDMLVVHATKGFEIESMKRMSSVIAEELGCEEGRIVVLSGPSHAEEVVKRCPTTVVVASQVAAQAELAQDLFMNPYFRVYTNRDMVGVELAGALKNIIALGAGMSDGLGYGDNAKAALLTRGLAEITRVGVEMGANPLTFAGLAGIGDLVVTATSRHSRNWRAGFMLGEGKPLETVLTQMGHGGGRHPHNESGACHLREISGANADCGAALPRPVRGSGSAHRRRSPNGTRPENGDGSHVPRNLGTMAHLRGSSKDGF
ncbi:hypothetical protein HMSSN139_25720 [Paenibacillus sp. HMSSN-139]|nr:hypothetical protein HMSSN139_25720 [Paenibacillus sp. HMSSN-139]